MIKPASNWLQSALTLLPVALLSTACAVGDLGSFKSGGSNDDGADDSAQGEEFPCGIDCSTIAPPDCKQAVCNLDTLQCEIVNAEEGTSCEDGLFCTAGDYCSAGVCQGGLPNDCGMSAGGCQAVSCNEGTQSCSAVPAADGTTCDAGDLCTVNATCSNGACVGSPKSCLFANVPNECHVATCNPANGMCESAPGNEGDSCVDQDDLCTDGKTCSAGECVGGAPKDCSAMSGGCFLGACDDTTGSCFADPIAQGESCADASDYCNAGSCDVSGNCVGNPINVAGFCEDGDPCTFGETCSAAGVCEGGSAGAAPTTEVYFFEDFADNSAGWTLGPEWEIGAAAESSGQSSGSPDPAADYTDTADNGLAGVVIGGNAAKSEHDFYYLTSPTVDLSSTTGPVWLSFRRWLNSDYTPYMQNRIQVWDGTAWVTIWETGGSPGVKDDAWQHITHDVAYYRNADFQVRFGFNVGSSIGLFTVSQWNIDDVSLTNNVSGEVAACQPM